MTNDVTDVTAVATMERTRRPITRYQVRVMEALLDLLEILGQSPTLVEMAEWTGLGAPTVKYHLLGLELGGWVIYHQARRRGVALRAGADEVRAAIAETKARAA